MSNYSFKEQVEFEKRRQELLIRDLYPKISTEREFEVVNDYTRQKEYHWDVIVYKNNKTCTIDEKHRNMYFPGDFLIETHSNYEKSIKSGVPDGWIYTSRASHILYTFTTNNGLDVYIMRFDKLKSVFLSKMNSLNGSESSTEEKYHTKFKFLPSKFVTFSNYFSLKW